MPARKILPRPIRHRTPPVEAAWKVIVSSLGYDPRNPHLAGSPVRIARFFNDWHTMDKEPPRLTTFPNVPKCDELVIVGGLQFYSLCAHHGVPFFGTAAIGYIPRDKVLGLSKFARVVDYFANRFQTQEQLTHEIASHLQKTLSPRGLGVLLQAEHLCMSMRGIRKPGHCTTTSMLVGACKKNPATRAELMSLARGVR